MDPVEWSQLVEGWLRRPPLIRCRGKIPLDTEWSTGPWEHPDEWRARLDGWTDDVGMLTGRGLMVVDVDLYKPEAAGSLDALIDAGRMNLDTLVALTPRGGQHFYYAYDPGLHVPSRPLPNFPGIDIKADGGYVVIPPGP